MPDRCGHSIALLTHLKLYGGRQLHPQLWETLRMACEILSAWYCWSEEASRPVMLTDQSIWRTDLRSE